MRPLGGASSLALAVATLLGSLSAVARRQARALDTLEALDQVRTERSLYQAERKDLAERVERLESRGRVELEAWERLGLRVPHAGEIVLLSGESS